MMVPAVRSLSRALASIWPWNPKPSKVSHSSRSRSEELLGMPRDFLMARPEVVGQFQVSAHLQTRRLNAS